MSDTETSAMRKYNHQETVDHPKHYNTNPSGVECIDVVQHMTFNQGNAVKYLWRMFDKGDPIENLEKAIWYCNQERTRLLLERATSVVTPRPIINHNTGKLE